MTNDGLIEALHEAGPAGPDAERLQLYGQFVGSWDVTWAGIGADGRPVTARGGSAPATTTAAAVTTTGRATGTTSELPPV